MRTIYCFAIINIIFVDFLCILHLFTNQNLLKHSFSNLCKTSWALRSSWHAIISHPAAIGIHPHVTHHVCGNTHGGLRGVACNRAYRAFWHAVVSIPAASSEAIVTSDISGTTDRGSWIIACWGADRICWHAVVTVPAVTMVAHMQSQ